MTEIRALAPGERPALEFLLAEIGRHYTGTPRPAADCARAAREIAEDGFLACLIAWDGPDPLGLAIFTFLQPTPRAGGSLFLKELFVRGAARGRGVGRALMRRLAETAKARGCERLDWTTERDLTGAIAFYAAMGAPVLDEKIYYRVTDDGFDALIARLGG